jgi:hypothetical protein
MEEDGEPAWHVGPGKVDVSDTRDWYSCSWIMFLSVEVAVNRSSSPSGPAVSLLP